MLVCSLLTWVAIIQKIERNTTLQGQRNGYVTTKKSKIHFLMQG